MFTVLVVDDSKIMRNIISERIKESGFKVIGQAENGYEAISKFKLLKPDIVTMDITMPEINQVNSGIDAVRKIKEINSNARIIMITSHGEETKVIEAITAGAKGYILKPVSIMKIKEVFNKLRDSIIEQSNEISCDLKKPLVSDGNNSVCEHKNEIPNNAS